MFWRDSLCGERAPATIGLNRSRTPPCRPPTQFVHVGGKAETDITKRVSSVEHVKTAEEMLIAFGLIPSGHVRVSEAAMIGRVAEVGACMKPTSTRSDPSQSDAST